MENLPKYEDFKDSLVAFIDVLGFENRVRSIQSQQQFFEVGKLLYAAKATADSLNQAEDILQNFQITAISDSLIVTVPFKDPICTVGMLHILHNIQYELVATNFKTLLRGYIARGPVYHKNGLMFGAGYSDAYRGEGIIGTAPRIVLSPDIVKDAKKIISSYSGEEVVTTALDFLLEDTSDGFYFINYFKPVGNLSVLPKKQLLDERKTIIDFVQLSLQKYETNHKVFAKYKWLENYFKISSEYF